MINHPDNDELSLFFLAYDMDDALGAAPFEKTNACIPAGYSGELGGPGHGANHAWVQQIPSTTTIAGKTYTQMTTYHGRIVVSAHEIGHMLGMMHHLGKIEDCAGGAFSDYCGHTLMYSSPFVGESEVDERAYFFAAQNDARTAACLEALE